LTVRGADRVEPNQAAKVGKPLNSVWTTQWSKRHNREYWFNVETGESTWVQPTEADAPTADSDDSSLGIFSTLKVESPNLTPAIVPFDALGTSVRPFRDAIVILRGQVIHEPSANKLKDPSKMTKYECRMELFERGYGDGQQGWTRDNYDAMVSDHAKNILKKMAKSKQNAVAIVDVTGEEEG
jgi:WW domain